MSLDGWPFCYFSHMLILYKIAIYSYQFLIFIFSLTNKKARKFRLGRKGWISKLEQHLADNTQKIVWIHAASLGEFEQGRPIIEALKKNKSDIKILLTFFSPSGYEVRKDYEYADWIHYLPLDTAKNARKFISIVNPALAIFIKYEFWYFFLRELNSEAIPTIIVSSIFRKDQLFFHWSGSFFKPIFEKVNHFFVQDKESMKLISSINDNVTIAGDTRFDRVIEISERVQKFELIEKFLSGEKPFVIGSSWSSDLKVLEPFIKKYQAKIKFIIAPHNIDDDAIGAIESQYEKVVKYSHSIDLENQRILIVDNVGMLSSLYKYAKYAYIGGGFRGALHNTLEAAVYGIPVFFGDHANNQKFKEAIELKDSGAAFPISSAKDIEERLEELSHIDKYNSVALAAFDYVRSKSGATEKVMKKVIKLV